MCIRDRVIAPGSDADIVLIDPSIKKRLTGDDFHITDYSIWEGFEIEGWPSTTILRGSVVVENGQLHATLGGGQFIRRKVATDITNRPAC